MVKNSTVVYLDKEREEIFGDIWCDLEKEKDVELSGNEIWEHILENTSLSINEEVIKKPDKEKRYDVELSDTQFTKLRILCHRLNTHIFPKGLEYCLDNYVYEENKNKKKEFFTSILISHHKKLPHFLKSKETNKKTLKRKYTEFLQDYCRLVKYEFNIDIYNECIDVLDELFKDDGNILHFMFWKIYETNEYFGNHITDFNILLRTNAILVTNEALKKKYGLLQSLGKMDLVNDYFLKEIWE